MAKSKGVGEHQEKSNPGCVLGPVAVGSPLFRPSGGISRVRDIEALDVAHIKYSVHNIPASTLSSIKRLFAPTMWIRCVLAFCVKPLQTVRLPGYGVGLEFCSAR